MWLCEVPGDAQLAGICDGLSQYSGNIIMSGTGHHDILTNPGYTQIGVSGPLGCARTRFANRDRSARSSQTRDRRTRRRRGRAYGSATLRRLELHGQHRRCRWATLALALAQVLARGSWWVGQCFGGTRHFCKGTRWSSYGLWGVPEQGQEEDGVHEE
jgi:hypothetical protein